MLRHWELYLQEMIKGQRQGFVPAVIKIFLMPLSWLFQLIVSCRNWFFIKGGLGVIILLFGLSSASAISSLETGKTPVTLMLAKAFTINIALQSFQGDIGRQPSASPRLLPYARGADRGTRLFIAAMSLICWRPISLKLMFS